MGSGGELCDEPIFGVSNDIAYGGMMVYGTPHRDGYPGANGWIDVPTDRSEGNWVPAEGACLIDLVTELTARGVDPAQIFAISPFRDAAGEMRKSLDRTGIDVGQQVGTVHTFQGQEADVVVLVLGSHPHRPRTREWAAGRPNLLDVAVSRARRRLYVIGDRNSWRQQPHFDRLADVLDDR